MRLKTVVLPAPLGPMIPVISFLACTMAKPATAATPPKFLLMSTTRKTSMLNGFGSPSQDLPWRQLPASKDPLGPEYGDEEDGQGQQDVPPDVDEAEKFTERIIDNRRDDRSCDAVDPTHEGDDNQFG